MTTTKKILFTVELKARVHDRPQGVEQRDIFERVQRLGQNIANDEKALIEVYKAIFFDLLFADYYSDVIRRKAKTRAEKQLILPNARKLSSQDSEFFARLFSKEAEEDLRLGKDNILDLFYSQFEDPEVMEVQFCFLDGNAAEM